jgi:hypothetical protein
MSYTGVALITSQPETLDASITALRRKLAAFGFRVVFTLDLGYLNIALLAFDEAF